MNREKVSFVSATSLVGAPVRNSQGDQVGHIKDIIFDCDHGRIAYTVMSFEEFFGVNEQLFPVPREVLEVDPEREGLILDVMDAVIRKAPSLGREGLTEPPSYGFIREVYQHYGRQPYFDQDLD